MILSPRHIFWVVGIFVCGVVLPQTVHAATLGLFPDTGVYSVGGTFTARVVVNTNGQAVNAAEGELTFDPNNLSVISISKAGSVFTLWTREPEFSNTTGKIYFGGGSPGRTGYTGSAGTVMTVTFRAKYAGTTQVTYGAGSLLAADGRGTNILSSMKGASYTVQAVTEVPPPEYVPPANTPAMPVVSSETHPDPQGWYTGKEAKLSWNIPEGVTGLRTLLDRNPGTVPTKVYDTLIRTITISDLEEGASYFHIQFKNAEGWGRVAHYRLGVDSVKPDSFTIEPTSDNDSTRPEQRFRFSLTEEGSGVAYYLIQIDGGERVRYEDKEKTGVYQTEALEPGAHTIVVEAFDFAGNSVVGSYSFVIEAFEAPIFTEHPDTVPSSVIPVLRGTTRPHAEVSVSVQKIGSAAVVTHVTANQDGVFTFIPENRLSEGVYEISARAKDANGGLSLSSDTIRLAVQQPGFVRIGGMLISILSIFVPLVGMLFLMSFAVWYLWHRSVVLRRRVRKEVLEAEQSLAHEFSEIVTGLQGDLDALTKIRKTRITKQEQAVFESVRKNLVRAEERVRKEIEDIEHI